MRHRDNGFSLIELLVVIVILGILSAVVVMAVGRSTSDAEDVACIADKHVLITATEAFFAQRSTTTIPSAGGDQGYQQTLVAEQFMRQTSDYYNLDAAGTLTNRSDKRRDYTLFVEVDGARGDRMLVGQLDDVAAGATVDWAVSDRARVAAGPCDADLSVHGPFPFGIELDPIDR